MKKVYACLIAGLFMVISTGIYAQQTEAKPEISKAQQERMDLMRSKGIETSLTILPIGLMGKPFDRLAEVAGLFMEEQGLMNIELDNTLFKPSSYPDLQKLADTVSKYVKSHPIKTDYLLYAEMNGSREQGFNELRAVVVDKAGEICWTDVQTPEDESFKNLDMVEPMTLCYLLNKRLSPMFGLNEETAKNAKPGKISAKMNERSGLPPKNELDAMKEQQIKFREAMPAGTIMVYPIRSKGKMNAADAKELVKLMNGAKMCKAVAAKKGLVLKASQNDPNELKTLWNMAREFREYIKENPPDADYALCGDYVFNPDNWEQGFVHLVVCNRNGDWVITDLQNSHHPDYRNIKPVSDKDCNKLLIKRLDLNLKWSVADEIRNTINSTGIDAAAEKFNELQKNTDKYLVSEDEMNMLGYEYLQDGKIKEAIEVFKLNVKAFPESFNVYDSLGEAYAADGNKEEAIKNYEKSLQLYPQSESGINALKKLKSQ